jgi:hypothetical protein
VSSCVPLRSRDGADETNSTDTNLLKTKKYAHLLESIEDRQRIVQEFLELIKPGLIYDVVPIQVSLSPGYAANQTYTNMCIA